MSATRFTRNMTGFRRLLNVGNRSRPVIFVMRQPPSCQVRHFYRGRDNPFHQMEEFMKDMERKFRRDMDHIFRDLPRVIESGMARVPEVKPRLRFGEMDDISTPETYKLAFNFSKASPEDVKVSLKGRTLSVSGSAEEVTETSKSSRQFSVQFEVPEGINLDAMESSISNDGVLTIEAPRIPPEIQDAPKSINIERE